MWRLNAYSSLFLPTRRVERGRGARSEARKFSVAAVTDWEVVGVVDGEGGLRRGKVSR